MIICSFSITFDYLLKRRGRFLSLSLSLLSHKILLFYTVFVCVSRIEERAVILCTEYCRVACNRGLTPPRPGHLSPLRSLFQAKLETKALKAKRPGFTDERYNETSYYVEHGQYLPLDVSNLILRRPKATFNAADLCVGP